MKTSDFDYSLPQQLIAQTPIEHREQSRLMVLGRRDGSIEHQRFFRLADYLQPGDVLVLNDSRVIPARLNGQKLDGGGRVEILLLRRLNPKVWEVLVRPGKRVKIGTKLEITGEMVPGNGHNAVVQAEVVGLGEGGTRVLSFADETSLLKLGKIPLPPYIHVPLPNPERYQTVYANMAGSVAAPTAGLHFTTGLIEKLRSRGIICLFITLHIGLDTFRPVREDNPLEHPMHREYGVIRREVADELSRAKATGRRIIAVGTTTVRLLEAAAQTNGLNQILPFEGWVNLFILPGYQFRMVDAMITNFHLPRSTLLMLISAFVGKSLAERAYEEAIARQYRFYSFGDAMLVI